MIAPLILSVALAAAAPVGSSDCSAAYGGGAESCEIVACSDAYKPFLGVWSGRFWAYVKERSTADRPFYRPYEDTVTYGASDCLRNTQNGDTFIAGHVVDTYPAFGGLPAQRVTSLLVTGRSADGSLFLRIVGKEGTYKYKSVYRNAAAGLAIWELDIPPSASSPAMTYTTIDQKDVASQQKATRSVTVTLTVGPAQTPFWNGVIAYGTHTRIETR